MNPDHRIETTKCPLPRDNNRVPEAPHGCVEFPVELAATIAIRELRQGLASFPVFKRVVACCFDGKTEEVYRSLAGHRNKLR